MMQPVAGHGKLQYPSTAQPLKPQKRLTRCGSGVTPWLLTMAGGITPEEYKDRLRVREQDRDQMHKAVLSPGTQNADKMHLRCEYILKYGKTTFSCPRCWLMPGMCICGRLSAFHPATRLIVHMHYNEW